MGSCFISRRLNAKTDKEVRAEFRVVVEECLYEYGHDSYNGTFSTMSGIDTKLDKVFPTETSAEDYIAENTEKWGNALAVTVQEDNKEPYTLIGGWAAE